MTELSCCLYITDTLTYQFSVYNGNLNSLVVYIYKGNFNSPVVFM